MPAYDTWHRLIGAAEAFGSEIYMGVWYPALCKSQTAWMRIYSLCNFITQGRCTLLLWIHTGICWILKHTLQLSYTVCVCVGLCMLPSLILSYYSLLCSHWTQLTWGALRRVSYDWPAKSWASSVTAIVVVIVFDVVNISPVSSTKLRGSFFNV